MGLLEKGENVTDFEIDQGDFVNTRTMSNMVSKLWSDQVEKEESGLLGDHQHVWILFPGIFAGSLRCPAKS